MNAQAGSYRNLQESINKIKSKNITSPSNMMMYVLHPYFHFLGYEIYDLDTVFNDFDKGLIQAKINDKITFTVALDDHVEYELTDEEDKIFLYFDYRNDKFVLKFKVLGEWKDVETVTFSVPEGNPKEMNEEGRLQQDKFIRLTRYIKLKDVLGQYNAKQERFFTEVVVDDMLAKGDWNNVFVQQSLANEFKNPSQDLINLLAARLGKDYTTQTNENIAEKLKPIIEEGLSGMVEYIVSMGLLPTSNSYSPYTPRPIVKEKESAKLNDKPMGQADLTNMADDFSSLGIKLGDSPKVEEPVETKPVEERTTNLEDLELGTDGSLSLDGLF